ncbi:MAG TPA: photosynthetic reaction center cytochrome c subunit family protein [Vicinamibacterales bacterium]|nr:photosynthetic reaction center cytochrome c subunit family protein [Vicinamibacterales bacterium]
MSGRNTRRNLLLLTAVLVCATSIAAAARQAAPAPPGAAPQMSETFFKDIRVLKGIPVDEFIDTMGMFAAATSKDCTGCHSPQILDGKPEAFAIETPMIQKARFMVGMMNTINRNFFGNQKRVSCFTCHSNTSAPQNVPNMAIQYGEPVDNPNSLEFIVASGSNPSQIDGVFAKYLDALGGAQRLNAVTSFTATGTYAGWDTGLSEVPVEIFARAPEQYATVAHRTEGDSIWTYDGQNAWEVSINAALPSAIPLTKGNLEGAKLEAIVALAPTRLRQAFARWQITKGLIDDMPVQILRGSNPGQQPVNFYFDNSGLLVRLERWNETLVGPVATQYDYSDYRDAGGVKRPFKWVKTSTRNQVTMVIKEIRPNVAIDAARFARPTTTRLIR